MKIAQLKKDLQNGNINSSLQYLSSANDVSIFSEFKEQKLFLIPIDKQMSNELRDAYKESTKRIITNPETLNTELNYLKFTDIYLFANNDLKRQLKEALKNYLDFNLKTFSFLIFQHVEFYATKLKDHLYQNSINKTPDRLSPDELSEFHSWCFNTLRGRVNDMMFAATNLINLFSDWQESYQSQKEITDIEVQENDVLHNALIISGYINSYNYALDKVNYGEWMVSGISICNNKPKITFKIIDERLEKARDIALKRITSDKLFIKKKKQRWLRDLLTEFALDAFDDAWDYYQNIGNIYLINNIEYKKAKDQVIKSLDGLDAEDELLVGMNPDDLEIASSYIIGCVLACYCIAASHLKHKSKKHLYTYTFPEIPYTHIANQVNKIFIWGKPIVNCLDLFICQLPVNQHLDLFKTPFIKDKNGKIYAVDYLSEDWTTWAKSFLMKGGKAADIVGKSWEGYIASIMRENHWQKVAQGVKVKKNGKLLTDIDILAKRDDLLLIVQMKVNYGKEINHFEQWKFRNKLKHAVEQIKVSERSIHEDLNILTSHFTKTEIKEIKRIQPVIITNSHLYNGWKYRGVPIMSTGSLMQIINGASVKFESTDGKIINTTQHINSDIISLDEFVDFLEKPLDWRIGDQDYQIKHHTEELEHSVLVFPLLGNNDRPIDMFKNK